MITRTLSLLAALTTIAILTTSQAATETSSAARFVSDGQDRFDGILYQTVPISSGALPTVSLSSGTASQVSATRTTHSHISWTADATNNAATFKVELSPDNSTFTTLYTASLAAAVNNTGAITLANQVTVPAGWYLKVTVVHAAITSCTYY